MFEIKVEAGMHIEKMPNGSYKEIKTGSSFASHFPFHSKFPDKYSLVREIADPQSRPAFLTTQQPPSSKTPDLGAGLGKPIDTEKKTIDAEKPPVDLESQKGKDVTSEFTDAEENGIKVFQNGKKYTVIGHKGEKVAEDVTKKNALIAIDDYLES